MTAGIGWKNLHLVGVVTNEKIPTVSCPGGDNTNRRQTAKTCGSEFETKK
jgi:hypothetical protein